MAFLRRSLTGLLALLTLTTATLALPAGPAAADAGDAVAGSPRAVAGRITAGERHSCVITSRSGESAGVVRCWGDNTIGQLGLGDTAHRGDQPGEMGSNLPAVDLGRPAVSITAGIGHTCAVLDDGAVKCWGYNNSGQLGLGDMDARGDQPGEMGANLPAVQLGTGRTARMISAGVQHTCALLDNGRVTCWGDNSLGQLGQGDTSARGNEPGEMGDALPYVDLGPNRTAIAISAGGSHTCAILDSHAVKCWGSSEVGQLGYGDTEHRGDQPGEMGADLPTVDLGTGMTARAITTGRFHTCAQITDTAVRCWGLNDKGQLGQGNTITRGDQPGEMGDALRAYDAIGAVGIDGLTSTAFGTCMLMRTLDGQDVVRSASCWGENDRGQFGTGDTFNYGSQGETSWFPSGPAIGQVLAIAGGGDHLCLVMLDHDVRCVGANESGQLGLGATDDRGDEQGETPALADIELRSSVDVDMLAAGTSHSCALLTDGSVKCWGENSSGQLGQGDVAQRGWNAAEMGDALPPVDLGTGRTATAVAVGNGTSCAILDTGALKCWGWNHRGQLGLGDTNSRGDEPGEMGDALPAVPLGTGRTAVSVSIGNGNVCAVLDDASLKCWGYNLFGQLAQGDQVQRGDDPGELGDALAPISFGPGRTVTAVAAGNSMACALLDDASLSCWGSGGFGKLGQGSTAAWGTSPQQVGAAMPRVDLGTGRSALQVAVSSDTVCAVRDDHRIVCWGSNEFGQLGVGTTAHVGDQPGEMGDSLVPVPVPTGQTVLEVSVGTRHACARFVSGRIQCWGGNSDGQLGVGAVDNRGDEPGELGDALPLVDFPVTSPATRLSAGAYHNCVLLGTDRVQCWGWNAFARLGNGESAHIGNAFRPVATSPRTDLGGDLSKVLPFVVTPGIPTGATAVAGELSATLSWSAPATDGGAPVTGYRIERSTDGGDVWSVLVANTGTTATTRAITGLTAGQSIRFRVAAINATGASAASLPSAAVSPTAPPAPPAPVDPQPTKPAKFVPLTPGRIADTRPDGETVDGQGVGPGPLGAGQTLTVQVTGRNNVPAGAGAAVLNVTAVLPQAGGFLTVYPCDADQPNASSVNYAAGQVVPNAVVSKLSAQGTVCIFTLATTHVLVDVTGAYPAGSAYTSVTPARIADTRLDGETVDGQGVGPGPLGAGQTLTVQVTGRGNVPAGAAAAVLNVTAVLPQSGGFLTVYPCDADKPNASSVNYAAGQIVPNAVVSKLAADGTVCIFTLATTHVLVDVTGAHPAGSGYTALTPGRIADTRPDGETVDGQGVGPGPLAAGQTLTVQVTGRNNVPAGATSAVLNVTAVLPQSGGFLTVYPCDADKPNASSVNYAAGQVVPNAVVTKLSAQGTVCIFTLATTHVLVDVTGAS